MRYLWLQAALAISVAFNIGLLIFMLNRPPAGHPHTPEDFLARVEGRMPSDDYRKLKAVMQRATPDILAKRAASDHAMQNVTDALKAEPFDDTALKLAMQGARAAHSETEQSFQNVILEAAPDLTHDGRLTLVPGPHPEASSDHH